MEPRQIFRDDVEKLKNRPHSPVEPQYYDDEDEYHPPSNYDSYQDSYETDEKPNYPTYSTYPTEEEDDYYQEPEYKPAHRPSYYTETNKKHRVPAYKPKPQSYQLALSKPSHKPTYDRPEYDEPEYDIHVYNGPDYGKPDYEKPDYDKTEYHKPEYHRPEYQKPDYDRPEYNNDYKNTYENEYTNDYNGGYNNEYSDTKPQDDKYYQVEPYRQKPRPTYPKEVILLQPGPAVKAVPYQHKPDGYSSGAVPGTPGKDYPNYSIVPETSFKCPYKSHHEQMYSDSEAGCQVSLKIPPFIFPSECIGYQSIYKSLGYLSIDVFSFQCTEMFPIFFKPNYLIRLLSLFRYQQIILTSCFKQ